VQQKSVKNPKENQIKFGDKIAKTALNTSAAATQASFR
jgi:hypothetical protein